MIAFCTFECFDRSFQCQLYIGSAGGDRIGIKGIGQLKKTGFVDGQRTLQECISGECDQAEPVGGIVFDNLLNEPLCLFHSGRFDVIGKHTFGYIEDNQQISAGSAVRQDLPSPGNPGGGDDCENDSEDQCGEPQIPFCSA